MTNQNFYNLFGKKPREPETKIGKFHMNIAASIQKVTEDILIKILTNVKDEYEIENLCLAGGVALNCVANGLILKEKIFKNIWIQPAAGDAGGSIGAALAFWYLHLNKKRDVNTRDDMKGSFLGPNFSDEHIKKSLDKIGAVYRKYKKSEMIKFIAKKLSIGNAVGWFQGRMEFGPRALGARSILADPRNKTMQKQLNLKIKFRESFRPFAPAVLEKHCNNWFNFNGVSPYMLLSQILMKIKLLTKKLSSNLYQLLIKKDLQYLVLLM